jgi:hypothetical protein
MATGIKIKNFSFIKISRRALFSHRQHGRNLPARQNETFRCSASAFFTFPFAQLMTRQTIPYRTRARLLFFSLFFREAIISTTSINAQARN